jgi:rhodanese-related sulfurtransferase/DNA-binding transcriptional ArsR family regulator
LNARTSSARQLLALAHYDEVARLGKVLASPARLRLLDLLRQGPRTVEALAEVSGLTVANASQHLQQMRSARVVATVRHGRHVEYRLASEDVSRVFAELRELAESLLPELDRLRRELGAPTPEEREAMLDRARRGEVTLLDVRPVEEYRAGHLPGARSIPLAELRQRLSELPRDREVVAYCRGPYCHLALEAVEILRAAGLAACHLDLGVPELRARRFRVVTGDGAKARARRPRARPPSTDRRDRSATP